MIENYRETFMSLLILSLIWQIFRRIKIMHNMGMLFVQMSRLEEAANSFEWVMRERSEFKAGLHAVLCHFALSHRDKMKRAFFELLEVQLNVDQEDKYSINPVSLARLYIVFTKTIYFSKSCQHLHCYISQCV